MRRASSGSAELEIQAGRNFPNKRKCGRQHVLQLKNFRNVMAAIVVCYSVTVVMSGQASALDPNKRVTQYIHTSWRTQDGTLPAGMFSITQSSDGFLWSLSLPGDTYRFDGVRFVPSHLPLGPSGKLFADHNGGLWIVDRELFHLKGGIITSHFELKGIHGFQSISEDSDGSLWVGRRAADAPLCHVDEVAR